MYFTNDEIKKLFSTRINQLKERLDPDFQINLYSRKKLPVKEQKSTYYKIDLKI